MEFTAVAGDLTKVLGVMRTIVPTRTTIPLINNICVEARADGVVLSGTDLTLELSIFEPCEVVTPGETTLPAHALFHLIKGLPSSKLVTIKLGEGRANVACGRSVYNLGTLPVEGFPRVQQPDDADIAFSLPAEDLMELIGATRSTTLENVEDRYFLQGICVHTIDADLVFASLNGKQFAQIRKERPPGLRDVPVLGAPILPNGFIKAMATVLSAQTPEAVVSLKIGKRRAALSVGDVTLTGRLIEGQFTEYQRLLPDRDRATFRVNAGEIGDALARLGIVYTGTDTKAPVVIIGCGNGSIDLTAGKVMGDQGSETVEAEIVSNSPPFGVSIQFLAQLVGMWPKEATLQIFSENPSAPILITSADVPNLTHVVMPMNPGAQVKRQVAAEAA